MSYFTHLGIKLDRNSNPVNAMFGPEAAMSASEVVKRFTHLIEQAVRQFCIGMTSYP